MLIRSIHIENYRSIRSLKLDDLGPYVVLYGKNGSGKSNVLAAVELVFRALEVTLSGQAREDIDWLLKALVEAGALSENDQRVGTKFGTPTTIAVGLSDVEVLNVQESPFPNELLWLKLSIHWIPSRVAPRCLWSLEIVGKEWSDAFSAARKAQSADRPLLDGIEAVMPRLVLKTGFRLIPADRSLRREKLETSSLPPEQTVVGHLARGELKSALFVAGTAPDTTLRTRLRTLRKFLEGPPLHRPPFDPVRDPQTGVVDLREPIDPARPEAGDVPLDLAGLGVAQVYNVLASIVLSGARSFAIEEPEAHLHAPTTGRHLRELLLRLVNEKLIDQLFIATHSNVFDLDSKGFYEVRLENGETVVERKPLSALDPTHLYEPGPALRGLRERLQTFDADEIVFHTGDGRAVTAQEMIERLERDDDDAIAFLADFHDAALRMVRGVARRKKASA